MISFISLTIGSWCPWTFSGGGPCADTDFLSPSGRRPLPDCCCCCFELAVYSGMGHEYDYLPLAPTAEVDLPPCAPNCSQ